MLLALDTESAGLGERIHRLGILTSNDDWLWLSLEQARTDTRWKKLIEQAEVVVGHNIIKYDARIIKRDLNFDLPREKVHDTLFMAAMHVPGDEPKDLLSLSMKFLQYDGQKDAVLHEAMGDDAWNLSKTTDQMLEDYCQQQLLNTLCLFVYFRKSTPQGPYDTERFLNWALAKMEARGVLVSRGKLEESRAALGSRIDELRSELYTLADGWQSSLPQQYRGMFGVDFNPNSPSQIGEILHARGFDLPENAKHVWSTSEENLTKLCGGDPFVMHLLELREAAKLKGTYVDGLLKCIAEDGCVHPNFSSTVARTGRLSCSDPNLQNVAGISKSAALIREAFRSRKFYNTYSIDYAQIEFRLAVFLSQDPIGLDEYNRGLDFHTATAAAIFNVPYEQVTKAQRFAAKTINFAIIYGAGADKIALMLNTPASKAASMLDKYAQHYAGMWEYKKRAMWRASRTHAVLLPHGRVLHIDKDDAYKAFNYEIQGGASEILKMAMVRIDELLADAWTHMLLQIHDELVVEQHIAENYLPDICHIMRTISNVCPLDVEVGRWEGSWANQKVEAPF